MRLDLDRRVRRRQNGRVLIGGYPLRVLRLSSSGARRIDDFRRGGMPIGDPERALRRRLIAGGLAFPRVEPAAPPHPNVEIVVPALDPPPGFDAAMVSALAAQPGALTIVDDGSLEPVAMPGATVVRHGSSLGPAAAREAGWRSTGDDTDIVVFIDADIAPTGRWLDRLVGHFADPDVVAVAPRVRSVPGPSLLARYEYQRSPLDLGSRSATVRPGSPVPYLPTAALAVRRDALVAVGGFDTDLRAGEDVDLVWRLVATGGGVLYDATIECEHQPRSSWGAWLRQRRTYGRSATALAARHGRQVSPLVLSRSAAAVVVGLVGGRWTAPLSAVAAAVGVDRLRRRLAEATDRPTIDAAALGAIGLSHSLTATAAAVRRAWLPLALAGAVGSRRARNTVLASFLVPPFVEWLRAGSDLSLGAWLTLSAIDDAAYCTGVWEGAVRGRSVAALLPGLTGD